MSDAFPSPAAPPSVKATGVSAAGPQTMIDIKMPNGAIVKFPATMSEEDIKAAAYKLQGTSAPEVDFWQDTGNTLKSLPARAVTRAMGAAGDVDELLHRGSQKFDELLGRDPNVYHPQRAAEMVPLDLGNGDGKETLADLFPTTEEARAGLGYHDPTPPKYRANKAVGEGLEAALAAGPFAPIMAGAKGTASLIRTAFGGGTGSEAAGQVAEEDFGAEPGGFTSTLARVLGGMGGSMVPGLTQRAIRPYNVRPENSEAARVLRREGIEVSPGQMRQDPFAKARERQAPNITDFTKKQQRQFTRAALRIAGIRGDSANQRVLRARFNELGGEFDDLSRNNTMRSDAQLGNDLQASWQEFNRNTAPATRPTIVQDHMRAIATHLRNNGGTIPGDVYQELRSTIRADARSWSSGVPSTEGFRVSSALNDLADDLDDAMERSMVAAGRHADVARWRQNRVLYRNLMVIEKAHEYVSLESASGVITPTALANATAIMHGRRNYSTGQGPFAELGNAGMMLLPDLPATGFAPKIAAPGSPLGSLLAAPGKAYTNWTVDTLSPNVRTWLNNQIPLVNRLPIGTPMADPMAIALAQGMVQSKATTGGKF